VSTESTTFRFIRTEAGSRLINLVLALTLLVAPIAFIEPSPYEAAVLVLGVTAFAFGLPLERRILPLFLLLVAWAVSGFFAMLPVFSNGKAVVYYEITVYLMITTVLFACLFAEDTETRVRTLANAWIVAAVGVSVVAIAAYFGAVPRADLFIVNGRATGSFKDPNVFAPFLILPLMVLIQRTFYRGPRLLNLAATVILLLALFLSFSRGAWGHFVLSAVVMLGLLFVTERDGRLKRKLIVMTLVAAAGIAVLIAIAMSFQSVRDMFTIRAELLQDYDSARTGRFGRQQEAVNVVIERPNGLGPLQFGPMFKGDVHNVYLSAFIAYGWAGGLAYLAIVLITLKRGLGAVLRNSPWRSFLAAAYATFVGLAVEGLIIDTDHWRHFFLLVGVIWGLAIATGKLKDAEKARLRRRRNADDVSAVSVGAAAEPSAAAAMTARTPRTRRRSPAIEWSRPMPVIERARRPA
jgi:O-antigen ligase